MPSEMPMQTQREVVLRLSKAGLDVREAKKATSDLVTYCNQNTLLASSLILGELRKINPHFNEEIFQYLQSTDQDFSLQNHRSHEKHSNMDRVNRLAKVFSSSCEKYS
jgi:argininosuccinate lyase